MQKTSTSVATWSKVLMALGVVVAIGSTTYQMFGAPKDLTTWLTAAAGGLIGFIGLAGYRFSKKLRRQS